MMLFKHDFFNNKHYDPEWFYNFEKCLTEIFNTIKSGHSIYICGNGGSMADAMHFAAEFTKNFMFARKDIAFENKKKKFLNKKANKEYKNMILKLQPGVPIIAFDNLAAITAIANDIDFSMVFAQLVVTYCHEGDLIIFLTTSGNSQNIINAAISSKFMNIKSLCITSKASGKITEMCDMVICTDATTTKEIQEETYMILHIICEIIEKMCYKA